MARVSLQLASAGPSAYWYLTRSTGAVSLLLLTFSIALGVADLNRLSTQRLPRFVIDALHRNVSLLALVFLALHIITSLLDTFTSISIVDAFVPFLGSYRPFWLGLGAVAFDLMLAVIITSLMRARLGYTSWRTVHWLAYASWPIALLHTFGTGSDAKSTWLQLLSAVCVLVVLASVLTRVFAGWPEHLAQRSAALGAVGAFALFLALWLPAGPLGSDWARRAGTPTTLLAHERTSTPSTSAR